MRSFNFTVLLILLAIGIMGATMVDWHSLHFAKRCIMVGGKLQQENGNLVCAMSYQMILRRFR